MTVRLFVDGPPIAGDEQALPAGAARHAQVRRVQPGDGIVLFDGSGAEWPATVTAMGRGEVRVRAGAARAVDRELARRVVLALGMPANDRMDDFVEKATELGAAAIQPLVCERSVLRLAGERAARRVEHWQGIATSAAGQCGRAKVPLVASVAAFDAWLAGAPPAGLRGLLLQPGAPVLPALPAGGVCLLSGPEGGLAPAEAEAARAAGFEPVGLGPRILRADTAPLAFLAWLSLQC